MLKCGTKEIGFATFICLSCGNKKKIPFSCKSRICNKCGKRYTDEWAEMVNARMADVPHRHIILTIPDKLRKYFFKCAKLQKLLMDVAGKVVKRVMRGVNSVKFKIEPGVVVVFHPFGDDLKFNPHVHLLVTEGGLLKGRNLIKLWINVNFIPYKTIRKIWQYELLVALKEERPWDKELKKIIDWCFEERKEGFVIHAKRRLEVFSKGIVKYISRYVRHPAISDKRIIDYDGKYVKFVYEEEGKEKVKEMEVFEFIEAVLKHIPDRNFKMVRYYGLYARKTYNDAIHLLKEIKRYFKKIINKFNWRNRKKIYTGFDPLICNKCGYEMVLFELTYRIRASPDFKTVGGFPWLFKRGELREVINIKKDTTNNLFQDNKKTNNQLGTQLF